MSEASAKEHCDQCGNRFAAEDLIVLLFIIGLHCSHCLEQVELFDRSLAAQRLKLVVISASNETANEFALRLQAPSISDPKRKWAGWFGLIGENTHGTLLLDKKGNECWRSTGHEPYMNAVEVIRRANRLGLVEPVRFSRSAVEKSLMNAN